MSPLLFPLIAVLIVVVSFWWTFSRARAMLEQWASQNGYQIVHRQVRFFRRGPFFWNSSRNQVVYYVTMRDRIGAERSGWVRCGSYWWGIFVNQTEVRWKDQP